jgi:hypothetical protein
VEEIEEVGLAIEALKIDAHLISWLRFLGLFDTSSEGARVPL